MFKIYTLIITAAAFGVSGCATQPVATTDAAPVPPERILASEFLKPGGEAGIVTVKRDSGLFGSGCSARLFVNAKPTAELRPSERITLYLPLGEHILSAQPTGMCGGGLVEVKANVGRQPTTFRMGAGTNGDFILVPTAF